MKYRRVLEALLLLCAVSAGLCAQSLAPGVDLNTVAFWPFDDPQYLNMVLTDAGPEHYDLRLRPEGKLSPGRYGNALEISSSTLPACMLAEWYGLQETLVQPDRPADAPTKILEALAGPDWTWEGWVRLRRTPTDEAALVHLKKAGASAFYCGFAPQARALILLDGVAHTDCRIPLLSSLSPGTWHHVALVKESRKNGVRHADFYASTQHARRGIALAGYAPVTTALATTIVTYTAYIDGQPQGADEPISAADPGTQGDVNEWMPGLIGITYADPDLARPHSPERVDNINESYGLSRGSGWSGAWRGAITIPTSATITLRADALWGVRVRVGNQLVINGWSPTGARGGTFTLPANTRTTFSCELNQRDGLDAHVRLYWSWAGHAEEIIPLTAFHYSTHDERKTQAELDAGVEPDTGLVGMIYGNINLTNPGGLEIVPQLNFAWGLTRGGGWSERYQGNIRSLTSQIITLRADCQWGLRIYIGNELKLDGMSNSGARTTTFTLPANTRTTFTLEYVQTQSSDARLKLYWSWPGHAEELIPLGMLGYSERDRRRVQAELDPTIVVDLPPRTEELRVGTAVNGSKPLNGWVDELRFSKSARYHAAFSPPASLTYTYGVAPPATVPNGPVPLFCGDIAQTLPLAVGGRKHVFLDGALFETTQGLSITANHWLRREKTNYVSGGDPGVYDDGTTITFYLANADMWNGGITAARHSAMLMARSSDGLTFKSPILNLVELDGSKANSVFLRDPVQGQVFIDDNPACPPEQKYKFTSFYMSRGLYLYTSPDGLHWTRNENNMSPPDCGGGVESFWDDQRGEYRSYIRHEGFLVHRGSTGRASALSTTTRPWAPWPFTPLPNPYLRLPLAMITFTTELPVPLQPEDRGELFRVRTVKYPWAADAYFAFTWRQTPDTSQFVGDLGYSRDGLQWSYTGPNYYMKVGETVGSGATITSVIPTMGIVRRGLEVWNYAMVQTTVAAQNGVYRYAQRLDGFFSLDAADAQGTAISKPLTFTGQRLQLNVRATGTIRVALVNADGSAIPAYSFANCEPITGDFVMTNVRWSGSDVITGISGPIRIKLEMQNAKLYALQFIP